MKRGEVWWVNFEPAVGGEIRKQRPAIIIISTDAANIRLNRVQVIPLTSNTGQVYPSEALIFFRGKEHKALADQIKTVSKLRVLNFIERLPDSDMGKVEQAIKVQLGLS